MEALFTYSPSKLKGPFADPSARRPVLLPEAIPATFPPKLKPGPPQIISLPKAILLAFRTGRPPHLPATAGEEAFLLCPQMSELVVMPTLIDQSWLRFAQPDVDGGLIGGASLVASDFLDICAAARR